MSQFLFHATVPVLTRFIESLDRILIAVEQMGDEQANAILSSRLAPDMLAFSAQVETAAYFALRAVYPLAGRVVPPFVASGPSVKALRHTVTESRRLIEALSPDEFNHAENRTLCDKAGSAVITLPGTQFLAEFALPNFFFHLNMAYAIARSHGCALGKAEYDGFHIY